MEESRNNIMFRKLKPYNGRNNTTSETEYARSLSKVENLKKKREELGEHLRIAHFGSQEEKSRLQEKIRQDAELQILIKNNKIEEEKKREELENLKLEAHRRALIALEKRKDDEKKEKYRQAQRENYIILNSKHEQNLYFKVKEDVKDRNLILEHIQSYTPNVL